MPVRMNGKIYYRTTEVCRVVGVSRTTFFRWLRDGTLKEATHRDRRGWRLFTQDEVSKFRVEANRITRIIN